MRTPVVVAEGGYGAGAWVGTTAAILLIFVVAAGIVALIWWLVQGRQGSFAKALLDPVVPISAVVITVGYELIVHR